MDLAVLEKYEIASNSGKGNAFNLAWEAKNIHGKESAKGLRAAFNPHTSQKSLAISYSAQADLQLFDHNGTQLATINSAGCLRLPTKCISLQCSAPHSLPECLDCQCNFLDCFVISHHMQGRNTSRYMGCLMATFFRQHGQYRFITLSTLLPAT